VSQVGALRSRGPRRRVGGDDAGRLRTWVDRIVPPLLVAVVVIGGWHLYVVATNINEILLPSPGRVASAFWSNKSLLASDAWVTIREIVYGYLLAVVFGVGLAMLVHASRMIERALYPWLVVSQMVPIPAVAPIFVLWTGFDIRPKLMVITLVCFFPIAVNTIDGLRAVEPELLNLLRTLGASRLQRFRMARIPAALPFVFSGLKVAAAFSVLGAVFGEWVGANSGLGYEILILNNQSATADMFAVIALLSVVGIAMFALVATAERLVLPWYHEARRDRRDDNLSTFELASPNRKVVVMADTRRSGGRESSDGQ
jgi:ABC-type nitrate/sulfonate/bicarbonate transport system permease component